MLFYLGKLYQFEIEPQIRYSMFVIKTVRNLLYSILDRTCFSLIFEKSDLLTCMINRL